MTRYERRYQCRAGVVGMHEAKIRQKLRKHGLLPGIRTFPVEKAIEMAGL